MKISEKGASIIKKYEGLRLKAYKPVKEEKYFTIGYGHCGSDVKQGMTITKQQAEELFNKDIVKYENYVNRLNRNFNQNEFDALVSFTYNCGSGALSTLVRNRNNKQIADALLLYNKDATGKKSEGLLKRRNLERDLFLTPVTSMVANEVNKLPYNVKAKTNLNVRTGPSTSSPLLRTVPKGTVFKVWAICSNNGLKWGKNNNEYFCLDYCERC